MKKCFVFCHGFGFDGSFWNKLIPFFSGDFCVSLDLGYFGKHQKLPFIDNNTCLIGIGHSLGFVKLLELEKKPDCLIGLNAFINFLGNNLNLYKKRYKELQSMKYSFMKYPYLTLKRFYQRCGIPNQTDSLLKLKKEKIKKDFHSFFKAFSITENVPTLLLGSKDDPVISTEVIEDNFVCYNNVTIQILDQGKHALGFLEAEEVHKRIKSFLHAVHQEENSKKLFKS